MPRSTTLASQTASSLMPLWMSSRRCDCGGLRVLDELVDLAGDVAFEAANRFPAGLAIGDASVQGLAGGGGPPPGGQHKGGGGAERVGGAPPGGGGGRAALRG